MASHGNWKFVRHMRVLNTVLLEVMARRITRLIITMPPQHGKSTFTTRYFSGYYLGNLPDHEVIIAAYEASFASNWGGRIRDDMQEFGPSLWGLTVQHNRSANDDWRLASTVPTRRVTGGMRTAGIGTGITGRPMHLGIIDDPFKDNVQAMSPTYRQRVWDWYESSFMSRAQPNTCVIVQHTRWHEDDLIGRLLEQQGDDWTVVNLPAIAERDDDVLGRHRGEALWPEKYDEAFLADVEDKIDPYWWAALYQQRPSPAGGGIFLKKWWRFWTPRGVDLPPVRINIEGEESWEAPTMTIPAEFDDACQSWDLTFDSASSRVAGGAWKRRGANYFLTDAVSGEWDFPAQIDALRRFTENNPITAKLIEDKANARAMASTVRNAISGVILQPVNGDKELRARAVSPLVRAGNVYLPHPAIAPWVTQYINELAAFPTGRYDDHVDQTSQALQYLEQGASREGRSNSSGTRSMSSLRA